MCLLLKFMLLASICGYSAAFLDSLYMQLGANCQGHNQFVCRNSKCVPKEKRCDGHSDCLDGSDEEDCDQFHCKEPNFFKCKNGHCIYHSFVCDGEGDCGDYSDEANCSEFKYSVTTPTNCSSDEWQCADKLCIPKDFVCNGESECLDGTDETIGCTLNLECDGFKCKNGHCVPKEWRCDGSDDCHDNSDELGCHIQIKPQECTLDNKFYLCADNVTCINSTNVCDKVTNCPDKSDENGKCNGPMNCKNHPCSHDCIQLPTGPKCMCPSGYKTIDDKTCQDINECEIYGICSQKCKNTPGSYECYCDKKYVLQEDKKTCKVVGGEAMMVFSTKTEIRVYFLESTLYYPLAKDLKEVVGVEYDGHHIYWTDIHEEQESIIRSLEDGSNKELIVTSGLGAPEDLAIDWITGNVYFTDSEMHHIGVCNNNGTSCTVLVNKDIGKPRGIVLHPSEGDMYWSDWGNKPEIAKSKMDGTKDFTFVGNNIVWPNGLTIDFPNDRLYWTDGKLSTLESIRLDGTGRRIVLEGIVKHPYAISIFEDRLYWSDFKNHAIESCNKFTGKDHHTLVEERREYIYGLHIFHSALKPTSPNPCSLSFCSDICLISGKKSFTCACPEDKILSQDKHTCKDIDKKQVLVAGVKDMLYKIEHQLLGKHDVAAMQIAVKNIGALTYSSQNNTMFVSDIDSHTIVAVNLDTGVTKPLVTENVGTVTSLDYDAYGNNLYWCDPERQTVEILSLNTMSRKILLHDLGGESPTSIALIPEESVMFVVMRKATEKAVHIDRIRLDGTARTHVVESGLIGDVTLHYDSTLHSIFWADAGTSNIELTSADGDGRHSFRALRTTPVSITTLDKDLFWTNYKSRKIYWAPKDNSGRGTNKRITLVLPENTEIVHLASVTPQPVPYHPCQKNNGNCSHLCIVSGKGTSCACPMGMALAANNMTCIKRKECTPNEFYCEKTDICIDRKLRCNKVKNCLMGEDEEECIYPTECPSNYFQCANGECIRSNLVCDLHYDCADRSDEANCGGKNVKACPKNHFKCSDDTCIHERFVCDGVGDCSDRGDEQFCLSTTCAFNQFRCLSGVCIPKNWECDYEFDCSDLSDEHSGCAQRTCSPDQFTCDNGLCIYNILKCNGLNDCGDDSDEKNCVHANDYGCRPNEFQCTSDTNICIPQTAKCNGTSECPHHEDEQGCSDCRIDEYECNNKKCIPTNWICDNSDDCGDGSDESICDVGASVVENRDVPCPNGFKCKSGACIEYDLVCNGIENCYDGSDENGSCNSSCKGTMNPCDHKCQATPSGPMCLCNEGYELSGDGRSCKDILECSKEPPVCSQLCIEKSGGYSCDCYEGYMIRSDKFSCKSMGNSMSLIYTIDNEIRQLSQVENSLNILHKEDTPKITGLDVSVANDYLYFSIEEAGTIHRVNLKNNTREYIKEVGKPQKLAVDWVTDNIYYVDARTTDKTIKACNFKEQHCAKILNIDIHSQVTSLVVDAYNKFLFYTETTWWMFNNPHSTLYKLNLDGSKKHEIVKSSSGHITGIAFNADSKVLYYLDQHNGYIHRVNYDGTDRSVLLTNISKAVGLNFFEDNLYYLTNYGYMGKCRLFGAERSCENFRLAGYSADLFTIMQESRQKKGVNMCTNHQCSHICVPSDVGAHCLCPSGKEIADATECPTQHLEETVRPFFGTHEYANENEASGSLTAAILIPIIIVLISVGAYYFLKKRTTGKFNVSMRFHNPIYGQPPSECSRPILEPGEHEYCNPMDQNRDFQAVSNAILEKTNCNDRLDAFLKGDI